MMTSVSRSLMRVSPIRQLHTLPVSTAARSFSGTYPRRRDVGGSGGGSGGLGGPLSFFGRPRLPANKGIMFVPQQEAWVSILSMNWDSDIPE